MKISACMIARNESQNIEKCINSYKEIVDEIILVDTGSTDNTIRIAETHGAKVLHKPWNDDFSAPRNYALDHSNGDWIIFLDADEYFTDASIFELKKILKKIDKKQKYEAIISPIYNIDTKENRIIEIAPALRVFRNKQDIRFVGRIHEAPKKDGRFLNVFQTENVQIYHTGYSSDIIEEKLERNLKFLKEEEAKEEVDVLTYFYMVETCFPLKKYAEVIHFADIFMKSKDYEKMLQTLPQVFRTYIYISKAMSFMKDDYTDNDIYNTISESLKRFPFHPEVKKNEAEFFFKSGKFEQAQKSFKDTINLQKKYHYFYSNKFQRSLDKVLYTIGEIYFLKGNHDQAFEYFLESVKTNKYYEASFDRIISMTKNKGHSEMIQLLNSIYNLKEFKDIEFLSINLAKLKVKTPFFYYFIKNWNSKYDDYGNLMAIALLLNGDATKSLEMSFSRYLKEKNDENELYTVISLIYGDYSDWYKKNKQQLSSKYHKILDVYFMGKKHSDSLDEEIECYQILLKELFPFENKQVFHRFMSRTPDLMIESFEAIGDILKDNEYYDLAVDYFKKLAIRQSSGMEQKGQAYCKMGFCYYHMKAYEDSVDSFEQALLFENNNYEPIQYLEWIKEKDVQNNLKDKICRLTANY